MERRFLRTGVLIIMGLLVVGIVLAGCNLEPSGEALYTLNCAGCHGTAGRGGRATALSTLNYLGGHDDTFIARITREGIPASGMRGFGKAHGGTLTDEQIGILTRYLRSVPSAQ